MPTAPTPAPASPAIALTFATLWQHYPNRDPCLNPGTGKPAYDNQCAIRLGQALERSGVNFASFKGPRCEFGPRGNGMGQRASELARWLRTRPFKECPVGVPGPGKDFATRLAGRTGIVFFEDYWLRQGERHPTGDHIDLWRLDRLTPSFETFMRFTLGIGSWRMPDLRGGHRQIFSDLENARQVTFWAIA